jgi:hypothetical protein
MQQHLHLSLGNVPKVDNGCHQIKGAKVYFRDGCKHRPNGPAVIQRDGTQEYFFQGIRHREGDKPAVIFPDGKLEYWENGKLIKIDKVEPHEAKLM